MQIKIPKTGILQLDRLIISMYKNKFIRYVIIGSFATSVNLVLMFILTSILGLYYMLSLFISYPIGTFTHFFMNKYLNFKNRTSRPAKQLIVYWSINLSGLVITATIMYILVEFVGIWYLIANVIASCIVVIYSFHMHKRITFRM